MDKSDFRIPKYNKNFYIYLKIMLVEKGYMSEHEDIYEFLGENSVYIYDTPRIIIPDYKIKR
jgi:hypothetical protein